MSTILLVEDTMANRALAVKLLRDAGHQVIAAIGPQPAHRLPTVHVSGTPDEALAAGSDGYLSKSIDALTFADTVSRFAVERRG